MRRARAAGVVLVILAGLLAGCGLVPGGLGSGGPDVRRWFSDERSAELARAVAKGDRPLIAELVAKGADPNATGTDRITMLQWAIRSGSPDGLAELLRQGATVDALGSSGKAALHDAAVEGDGSFVRELLASGADPDVEQTSTRSVPLTSTCLNYRVENLEALVAAGADVNHVDQLGERPIHTCARVNGGAMVLRLLELGTDPRARNTRGATFQDYYFSIDPRVLNDRARAERTAVVAWLRAHDVPVNPEAFR